MPFPSVRDDGRTIELDLHGATIEDAIHLVRRTLDLASQRGRSSVKVIHGSSTTDSGSGPGTIKSALTERIRENSLHNGIASHWFSADFVILSLPITQKSDATPLTMLDLQRQ